MHRCHGPILVAAALFTSAPLTAGDAEEEQKKFQGKWEVLFLEAGGVKVPTKKVNSGLQVVIDGDRMKFVHAKEKEGDWEASFKLDPAAKLKAIDLTNLDGLFKGQRVLGIYAWEGAGLKLCFPDDPENDKLRPKSFATPKGTTLRVYYLKKLAK